MLHEWQIHQLPSQGRALQYGMVKFASGCPCTCLKSMRISNQVGVSMEPFLRRVAARARQQSGEKAATATEVLSSLGNQTYE